MTRDLSDEGPVPGQMEITPDDIRNPPCGDACPFVRGCLICKFQPGHPPQKGGHRNHEDSNHQA